MANSAALELILELSGNADKQLASIQKELQGTQHQMEAAQKSAGFFGNALAVATGGLITSGIDAVASHFSDFISSGISDAQGAIGLMAQTQAVLTSTGNAAGVTAEHIAEYASSLSDATGKSLFGDDQIQQSENLLLTFTNIKGTVLDAATAISVDMAQALGGAPKDSAIQLGKALNDPIAGISALSRVGVTFDAQQKAQIKTMQDAGNVAGAQGIILKELNKEFGGSAAAAAGATGGIAQLKGMLGEFGEGIGAAVLPGMQTLTGFLTSPDMLAALQSVGDTIAHGVGDAMTWLTTTAIPALIAGWQSIAPTIGTVVTAFQDAASYIGTDGIGAAISTLGADLSELNPAIGAAIQSLAPFADTIMAVGAALLDASSYLDSDGFGAALSTMGADIAEVNPVLGAFIQGLAPIGDALQTVSASLANNGAQWAAIQDTITQVSAGITAVVMAVFGQIAVFLQAHGTEIQATIQTAWTQIQGIIQTAIQIIQATIVPALAAIASFIQAHGTEIQAVLSAVWTTISTIITTTLAVIQGVLTATLQIIQGDWSGAWATIQATVQTVMSAMSTIVQAQLSAIQTVFASAWEAIKTAVLNALNSLSQGVMNALNSMAQTIFSTLNSVAGTAASQAAAIGAGIISGIAGTILARAGEIANAAASAVTNAIDAAKSAVGIHSPSRVAAEEIGVPFVAGIVAGIEHATPTLTTATATLHDSLMRFFNDFGDAGTVFGEAFDALPPKVQSVIEQINASGADGIGTLQNYFNGFDDAIQHLPPAMQDTVARLRAEFEGLPTDADASLTSLKTTFDRFLSDFGDWGQVFGPAFAALPAQIQGVIGQINDTLGSQGIGILQNYFNGFDDALAQLPAGVQDTVAQLRDQFTSLGDATATTSAVVQTAVDDMAAGVEGSTSALHESVFAFFDDFGDAGTILGDAFEKLPPQLQGVIEEISNTLGDQGIGALENYLNGFDAYLSQLPEDVQGFVKQLREDLNTIPDDVQQSTQAITDALQVQQQSAADLGPEIGQLGGVVDETGTTVQDTVQAIQDGVPNAEDAGHDLAMGVKSGMSSVHDELVDYAHHLVQDMIDEMRSTAQAASPSQATADSVGAPMAQGIAAGMESESGNLMDTSAALVNDSVDAMEAHTDTFHVGSSVVQDMIDGMAALMPDIQATLDEMLKVPIDSLSEEEQQSFKDMLDGFEGMVTDVNKLIEESFQSAISGIDDISKALSSAMSIWDQSDQMKGITKLTNDLGAAQQDYADTQAQIAQNEQAIADAKTQQTTDEAQLATLTSQQAADLEIVNRAQQDYQTASDDVTTIKQEQQDLQDQYNSGQIDQATYQQQSKDLQKELNAALDDQKTKQAAVKSAQDAYDTTTKSIAATQKHIKEDMQTQADLQQKGVDLASQLAKQQTAITKAQSELNDAINLNNQLYAIQQAELAQIAQAQEDASKIADPKEAEKYLKIQTDYAEQSASLQSQIAKAQAEHDDYQVALLKQQQDLLNQQHDIALQQFQYQQDTTTSTTEQVAQDVIVSLGEETTDALINLTTILGDLATVLDAMANAPGHARGTEYAPGGWSWVGEKGPELMYVPQGSQIYAHGDSPGGGGASYAITVDARGASDPQAIEAAGYRGAKRALEEVGATAQIRKRAR